MKRLLLFFSFALAMIGMANAAETSIKFSDKYSSNTVVDGTAINPNGDITIMFAKADGSTAPQYYSTGTPAVRTYAKNTLTISSSNGNITAIEFTWGGTKSAGFTPSTGSLTDTSWTGNASSVTFTAGASGQQHVTDIKVIYEGGDNNGDGDGDGDDDDDPTVTPTPGGDDTILYTDELIATNFSGISYTVSKDWTSASSKATYKAQATSNSGFQMRTSKPGCGIYVVTPSSNLIVKNITLEFSTAGGGVSVYASNSQISSASGTAIKTGVSGTTTLDINAPYFLIVPTNDTYTTVSKVTVNWVSANSSEEPGVEKTPVTLSYDPTEYSANLGESFDLPKLTVSETAAEKYVVYAIDPVDGIASLTEDKKSVIFDLSKTGKVTVTASLEENEEYTAEPASFTLTVTDPDATGYVLVTDAAQLGDEAEIIIVGADALVALSTNQKASNRGGVAITENTDGTVNLNEDVQIISLKKEGKNDNNDIYSFNVGDGYLYAASGSANQLKTQQTLNDNGKATITIDNNIATIQFTGSNLRNTLRFNPNSGDPLFSCYASDNTTGTLVRIYMNLNQEETLPKPELYFEYEGQKVEEPIEVDWDATQFPVLKTPDDVKFTVTYSSSNTKVAEIDDQGNITLKKVVGETVIKAETAEVEGQYAAASAQYTLVVLDPNSKKVTFDFTVKNPYGMTTVDGNSYQEGDTKAEEGIVSLDLTGRYRSYGSSSYDLRVYSSGVGSTLTFSLPVGYKFESIEFNGSTLNKLTTETGSLDNSGVWTCDEEVNNVEFKPVDGNPTIYTITVYYTYTEKVAIVEDTHIALADDGNSTGGVSDKGTIKAETSDTFITLVVSVPEGHTLWYKDERDDEVTSLALDEDYKPATNGEVKLYIGTGKLSLVYQHEERGEAGTPTVYSYTVTNDPTGVNGIESDAAEAVYFNLQGQKVANPEKGIYVKVLNGKAVKVVK